MVTTGWAGAPFADRGRDLGGRPVARQVIPTTVRTAPGGGGSPLLDATGRVTGMVFASNPATGAGYALAASQLRPDVTAGGHRTAAVPDGTCR